MVETVALTQLLAVLFLVAAIATYVVGVYVWRRLDHPLSDRFALFLFANGTWALFTLLQYVSPSDSLATSWGGPLVAIAALAAVFWFLFVLEYTDSLDWLPTPVERLLVLEPVCFGVVEALNPANLVYTELAVARWGIFRLPHHDFGPLLLGQLAFNYLLLLTSFVFLGRFYLRTRNLYRRQTGLVFSVTLLMTISTVVFLGGLSPHPHFDITPLLFIVQAVVVSYLLYVYDFLSVGPLAAHQLFEETVDPVLVVDGSKRLIDYNSAAERYIADSDATTLDDVAITDLETALAQTDSATAAEELEVTASPEDGDGPVTYDVRTTTLTDRFDIVHGYALTLRDITVQKRQREHLEQQNARLQEFAGIVSHDLRNPLQVASGNVELLGEEVESEKLDTASEALDRMDELIRHLLELASEGQTIDEKRVVDVGAHAREAWAGVDTADATLSVETDRQYHADPDRLRQLFENLFRNAVEHSQDAVTVAVVETDRGFAVTDDGPGIPTAKWDDVFEFGVSHDDGTGFGLAIVEQIALAHGWRIEVGETDGGGTRFDITTT